MPNRDALKAELIASDEEFGQLHAQHRRLEERLETLYQHTLLSQEDELEVKRIKREKLQLKDRMEQLLRDREQDRVSA